MSQPIRAVYKGGQLWLLDPVHLMAGQVICVLILSEEDRVRAALGGLVVLLAARVGEDVDKKALAREVEAGFRGPLPLSDPILEECRARYAILRRCPGPRARLQATCASAASAWGCQNVISIARYSSMAVDRAARACCPRPTRLYRVPRPR
jgi:hypothetical protein